MTKQIVPMFVALACTAAFAQTDTSRQSPQKGSKTDTVTVTGCVAEGTGGRFMLNNASMSSGSTSGMTSGGSGSTTSGGSGSTTSGGTTSGSGMSGSSASGQELRVQSVKMVSSTCP